MIRSTRNEGFASLSKQTVAVAGSGHTGTGVKGQGYESIEVTADGSPKEGRDEFGTHAAVDSLYPSNAFNGTFE